MEGIGQAIIGALISAGMMGGLIGMMDSNDSDSSAATIGMECEAEI